MRIKLLFALLSLILLSPSVKAQKHYWPIWTFHQDSIAIHGISMGALSSTIHPIYTTTNGLKLELIGAGIFLPFFSTSPLSESWEEYDSSRVYGQTEWVNGMALSATGMHCRCQMNGLTVGSIFQYQYQVNGASITMMNVVETHYGLQVGAFFSEAFISKGVQVGFGTSAQQSAGLNIGVTNTQVDMRGVQLSGIANTSEDMRGVQIGLYNVVEGELKGIQIGLWNVNSQRRLPLINWSF